MWSSAIFILIFVFSQSSIGGGGRGRPLAWRGPWLEYSSTEEFVFIRESTIPIVRLYTGLSKNDYFVQDKDDISTERMKTNNPMLLKQSSQGHLIFRYFIQNNIKLIRGKSKGVKLAISY